MEKRKYLTPSVEIIKLDCQISLQLESASPPAGPGDETTRISPEYMNNNPFENHLV